MRIKQTWRGNGGWLGTEEEEGTKTERRQRWMESMEKRGNEAKYEEWKRMREWGQDRWNKEKWCESGDPERGIAGRRKKKG